MARKRGGRRLGRVAHDFRCAPLNSVWRHGGFGTAGAGRAGEIASPAKGFARLVALCKMGCFNHGASCHIDLCHGGCYDSGRFSGGADVSRAGLFHAVKRLLQLQLLTILLAFALAWTLGGKGQAVSALLGGLIGFVPNVFFAALSGRKDPRKTAGQVVRALYFGETIKLFFTALLFVIVFQLPGIFPLPLFAAFLAVGAVFWFALLLHS
jgi:ATP synthase protein I